MMKSVLKILQLLSFKLCPLRHEVLFISFNGHYSDSPKAISEALHKQNPAIQQNWLVDSKRIRELPSYVNAIDIKSMEACKKLQTSKIIIDNTYCKKGLTLSNSIIKNIIAKILVAIYKRENQILISTWHGTPIKRIGLDANKSESTGFVCPPMYMVNGNRHVREVMDRITYRKMLMLDYGTPRNDVLFGCTDHKTLKRKLHIPEDKKVFLYAPTFRSDRGELYGKNINRSGLNQIKSIDFEQLFIALHDRFGGDWVFVGRFHYYVEQMVDWHKLDSLYPGKIINGNQCDDMADYLACADVLLTDCSSCLIDFSLTNKPCFILFPDIENYDKNERGFYFPVSALPFPLSVDFEGLLSNISTFNNEIYQDKVLSLLSHIGNYDDGNASKRVVEELIIKNLLR